MSLSFLRQAFFVQVYSEFDKESIGQDGRGSIQRLCSSITRLFPADQLPKLGVKTNYIELISMIKSAHVGHIQ